MKIINDLFQLLFNRKNRALGKQIDGGEVSQKAMARANTNDKIGNKALLSKQQSTMLFISAGILVILFGFIKLVQTKKEQAVVHKEKDQKIKIEVASENISPDEMRFRENKRMYEEAEKNYQASVKQIEEAAKTREQELMNETKEEISKLSEQLAFIAAELKSTNSKLNEAEKELEEKRAQDLEPKANKSEIQMQNLGGEIEYDVPKSTKYYIPETTFFSGNILEGIRVSTSDSTMQNPDPLTIKVVDNGNLSPNFAIPLKTCEVEASAHGNASTQRINIRLEKLVCTDPKTQLITTTEITGNVTGPDGINGVGGTIVDTSILQMRNAAAVGFLNGFVNAAKGQQSASITPLGAINTKKQGFDDILKDSSLSGASSGLEELAKYYIKKAEALAPVIQTPGAVRVQLHIRKGVFYGQLGVHKKVKQLRQENKEQQVGANE